MTAQAGGASSLFRSAAIARRQLRERRAPRSAARLREARDASRNSHASSVARNCLRPGRRIAVVLRLRSRSGPAHVIALARRTRLPAVPARRSPTIVTAACSFVRYRADSAMRVNRYGIAEPDRSPCRRHRRRDSSIWCCCRWSHSTRAAWRLGSGAGFYDRCLQHLRAGRRWRRPKLIGVGYECQRVAALAAAIAGTCRWTRCSPRNGLLRSFRRGARHELLVDEVRASTRSASTISPTRPRTAPPAGMACAISRRATTCARCRAAISCSSITPAATCRASPASPRYYARPIPTPPRSITKHDHYDADSDPDKPRWYMVDVKLVRKFDRVITLEELRRACERQAEGHDRARSAAIDCRSRR